MSKSPLLNNNLVALVVCAGLFASRAADLRSPDGRLDLNFALGNAAEHLTNATYSVARDGVMVIAPSQLGLDVAGAAWSGKLKLCSETKSAHDSKWKPVCGERNEIRDHYNQLEIALEEVDAPHRLINLTFRAYDEGVAFRYTIPKQAGMERIRISRERSEFRFVADHTAWAVYSAQGVYDRISLSQIKPGCERPLPIRVSDNLYVALGEAALTDCARMKFGPLAGVTNALVSELSSAVESDLPLTTSWRFIMIADSPARLLENNFLVLNLNAPCEFADTSWIKPGKVIREVTLTTVGAKACVDFAARRNLQYILFDAGWYGPEASNASDASAVNLDPKRSKGPLDLPESIRYANGRGIGVILYVNQHALTQQLDQILPLYRQWGVKGVKYGFVNVGSQKDTAWLHAAIRKAATNHLMIDIHDEYRPTGYQRTYPNLMTMEGIAGDETSPPNRDTLTHLFSRLLAGPADNTICYYDARVDKMASHAYQLAKAVCIFSPWQHLYWYDRPPGSPAKIGGAGGAETGIGNDPELEFFDALPTVWDDTKVLYGSIGEYAVIARRHGDEWFIGAMNSGEARTFDVSLKFLPRGKKFLAHIYADDPAMATRTHVRIEEKSVDADTVLKCGLSAQGGQAIRLTPQP